MLSRMVATFLLVLWSITFWRLSQVVKDWTDFKRATPAWWVSINVAASYLTLDAACSIVTIVTLLVLTPSPSDATASPVGLAVRYVGIGVIFVSVTLQFPIKVIARLVWEPFFDKDGFKPTKTWGDVAEQWRGALHDTTLWMAQSVFAGAIVPYFGVLALNAVVGAFAESAALAGETGFVFQWLEELSGWSAALVTIALFINLSVLTYNETK